MLIRKYCSVQLLVLFGGYVNVKAQEETRNCIPHTECPAINSKTNNASSLSQQEKSLLKSSKCSYIRYSDGKKTLMVNCGWYNTKTHRNLNLLPKDCGNADGKRVIGGEDAKNGDNPWMAIIYANTIDGVKPICGGTVINNRYVLTAAHCISENVFGVKLGEFDMTQTRDCYSDWDRQICTDTLDYEIEKKIVHEDYSLNPNPLHDIALLRLKMDQPLNFTATTRGSGFHVQPICLPTSFRDMTSLLNTKAASIAGWGIKNVMTREYANILQKADLAILTDQDCTTYYNSDTVPYYKKADVSTSICAGSAGIDTCQGDSGGPLLIVSSETGTQFVQVGIASFGSLSCATGRPGLYTDVTKYVSWILDNIRD